MDKDIRQELLQSVMEFAREEHADLIDAAYEYFWEEEDPEDFLGGTALSLGFINFEDWFVCDYRTEEDKSIIDMYRDSNKDLDESDLKALEALKDSHISIYEVVSAGDEVTLKDVLLDEEFSVRHDSLKPLNEGDLFATRFVALDGDRMMSRCVYPYSTGSKDSVLENFDITFTRYTKHNPEGSMRDFIKKFAYTFNILWLDNIFNSRRKN